MLVRLATFPGWGIPLVAQNVSSTVFARKDGIVDDAEADETLRTFLKTLALIHRTMAVIAVFSPHNDDFALGLGGTMAKHYKAGDDVHVFIASYGELSHPHYKPEIIRKTRVKEAQKADRVLGGDGRVQFLGLRELKFPQDFERKQYTSKLATMLRKLKPSKAYIPAPNELHPDHKAFGALILDVIEEAGLKCDVYAYYVYPNLHRLRGARLIVDVSGAYGTKLESIRAFRSQIHFFTYAVTNNFIFLYTLCRNWLVGFLRGVRFAETFRKVR